MFVRTIVCAFLFCLMIAQAAMADDTEVASASAPVVRRATVMEGEVKLDPYAMAYAQARERGTARGFADTYILDDIVVGGSMFGGVSKTFAKGEEEHYYSLFGGSVGNVRAHAFDLDLGAPLRVELGLAAKLMAGHFHGTSGPKYRSMWQSAGIFAEIVIRHDPPAEMALWSIMLRPGVTYVRSEGKSRVSGYEATEEVTYVTGEIQLDFYWPFAIKPDLEYWIGIDGAPVQVRGGWFPKITIWGEWNQQVHASRRSTVTRSGGRDRAHQNRGTIRGTLHVYRFVNETEDTEVEWLVEGSPYVLAGLTVAEANGYNSLDDDTEVYTPFVGAGLEVVFNRFCSFTLEGQAWFEADGPDRNGGSILFSLNIWGW